MREKSHWCFIPTIKEAKFLPFWMNHKNGNRKYRCVQCGGKSGELKNSDDFEAWASGHMCIKRTLNLRRR